MGVICSDKAADVVIFKASLSSPVGEVGVGPVEVGVGPVEVGVGPMEVGVGPVEVGVGPVEVGVRVRWDEAIIARCHNVALSMVSHR